MRRIGLLLFALIGCAPKPLQMELADRSFESAFLVIADSGQRPTRVSTGFGVSGGQLSFGVLPSFHLESGETRYFVVGFEPGALARGVGNLDPMRIRDAAVKPGSPPALPSGSSAARMTDLRLPDSAVVLALDDQGAISVVPAEERAGLVGGLVLSVPTTGCPTRTLQAYGQTALLETVPSEFDIRTFFRVLEIDAASSVVLARSAAHLIHRGGALDETRGPSLSINDLTLPFDLVGWEIGAMVVGDEVGGVRPVIFGGYSITRERGFLMDTTLGPDGFGATTASTVVLGAEPKLSAINDLIIDESGAVLGVGYDGQVWARARGAVAFTRVPSPPVPGGHGEGTTDTLWRIARTHQPARPLMIASNDGTLYQGDLTHGWDSDRAEGAAKIQWRGLVASADGSQRWAAADTGRLLRFDAGVWTQVKLDDLPSALEVCGTVTSMGPEIHRDLEAVAIDDATAYVVIKGCDILLAIDRVSGCKSAVTSPGMPLGTAFSLYGAAQGATLQFSGEHGALLELPPL